MEDRKIRIKPIPEYKIENVKKIAERMKSSKTFLIASTKGLPASQFQSIKSKLRGKAKIIVAKKSIVLRALKESEKGSLISLKDKIDANVALIFSELDAFELAGILTDSQSPSKAKVGDIAPEDIIVEEGPTELMPGPAISELGAVGLKVVVEGGKLAIKKGRTIAKKGEIIENKVVNVLGKLKIFPMRVGFIPVAAYDAVADEVYTEIKIDKKGALEELRRAIGKAFGFAVSVGYFTTETVKFFIAKAGLEEKALEAKIGSEKTDGSGEGENGGSSEEKKDKPEGAEELKVEEEKKDE